MTQLNDTKIKILTKNDLYKDYPFPYNFASALLYQSPTAIASKSLKELLFFVCFVSFDENTNEAISEDNFLTEDQETFSCLNAYFVVKNGVLYYLDFHSEIYFNLENLNYQDIIISSIMYIIVQNEKQRKFIPWLAIHEFLLKLKTPYSKSLCFFIKKTLCMKNERANCIKYLISVLQSNTEKKKYSKENIISILDLIEIDFNKANLITKNYISIFNKSSLLIDFLQGEIQ